jgi:endoglucanase
VRKLWLSSIALILSLATSQGLTQEISVSGTNFKRDGRDWVPKGVTLVGRVAPFIHMNSKEFRAAYDAFGDAELSEIGAFGADLIRFQVSQAANDPQSKIYDENYLEVVKQSVAAARRKGFNVIVSLQSEAPSGLDEMGMPNAKALRAWRRLAPAFAADLGVMLELFNEPSPEGPDRAPSHDWKAWAAAFQPLVNEIRRLGAKNVLLADGLYWAQTIRDAPQLTDPIDQIAYAVHPYFSHRIFNERSWDMNFGDMAAKHPVIATEWNALSFLQNCNNDTPRFAANILAYLKSKRIGLVAWAYDFPGALHGEKSAGLTNFANFRCSAHETYGAGSMVSEYFHTP